MCQDLCPSSAITISE
nr:hypothetical protein [Methanobacterium sp.]